MEKEKTFSIPKMHQSTELSAPKLDHERRATIMTAIELFTVVSSTILLFIAIVRFIVWIIDRKNNDQ